MLFQVQDVNPDITPAKKAGRTWPLWRIRTAIQCEGDE
jgi:hypothetical protein